MINNTKIKIEITKYNQVQGLMNYFNLNNLKEAHKQLDGNKALGVDKISKNKYSSNLEENLNNLINKMKKFEYHPKPVRRVSIPKDNGKVRHLGIPSYEDKIVQEVIVDILNNIYEPIFLNYSYGFRPNRNCHMALLEIKKLVEEKNINYIVDTDIKSFFDNINQNKLIEMLKEVIKDKHFIMYIRRFLETGIIDKNILIQSKQGTPQGGLISPILANIYLHYVLDQWFESYIKKQTKGECYLIRYADDFIMLFEYEEDSYYVYNKVIERLKEYNLQLQQEKTNIFYFSNNKLTNNTFNYLGLNIYNYKDNNSIKIGFKTNDKNIKRKYEDIYNYIYDNKEMSLITLCIRLNDKLRGYYNYYGFNTNIEWLVNIYTYTKLTLSEVAVIRYNLPSTLLNLYIEEKIIKPYIVINL